MIFRAVKYTLISISALLFCLVFALSFTPSTQWILTKVSDFVDGLSIVEPDGNLYSGISAQYLSWQQAGLSVELEELDFTLDWVCISQTQLCVEKLISSKLSVMVDTVAMAEASADEPTIEEPEESTGPWQPPFPFVLSLLDVNEASIIIDGIDISWQKIVAQANWVQQTIQVERLHLENWQVSLPAAPDKADKPKAAAKPVQDLLPLNIDVPQITMPYKVDVADLQLTKGKLILDSQELVFPVARLKGVLGFADIKLNELYAESPWGNLQLSGSQAFQGRYLSKLEGSWDMPLGEQQLITNFRLLGDGDDLDVELNTAGLVDSQLDVQVAWLQTNLPFEINADLAKAFTLVEEQLSLTSLSLRTSGDLSGYQLQLQSDLAGIQDLWLNAQLTGDLNQLQEFAIQGELLEKLVINQSEEKQDLDSSELDETDLQQENRNVVGGFQFTGDAAWQPKLSAQVNANIDNLQLSHWLDLGEDMALPDLDGELIAKIDEQVWSLEKANISGEWLALPLSITATANGDLAKQSNQLKALISLANTQIDSSVNLDAETVQLNANLTASQLGELPWLENGEANAVINVDGELSQPKFNWQIQAGQIKNRELSLDTLTSTGNLRLDESFTGKLELALANLKVAGELVNEASIQYLSENQSQELSLAVEQSERNLHLDLQGEGTLSSWQGQLAKADFTAELGTWYLSNPIALSYEETVASIGEHCWSRDSSELCLLEPFSTDGNSKLDLRIKDFDFTVMNHLMPEGTELVGQASADINAQFNQWNPETAKLSIRLSPGHVSQKTELEEVKLSYKILDVDADLSGEKLNWQALFESDELGALRTSGVTSIDKDGQIDGKLDIDNIRLSPLLPFVTVLDNLEGRIDGEVVVKGKVISPKLDGEINLTEGYVSGPDVPLSIEQLETKVLLDNQKASIDGKFNSEGRTAQWHGQFAWPNNKLEGELDINAKLLPIIVDPYATLAVSPDIKIKLVDDLVDVGGTIAVEEGAIKVKSLPESAVSESSDAIVIEEQGETVASQRTKIDVTVTLAEVITLEALGLNTNLKGHLNLKQQPSEPLLADGRIELVDGKFRAYGQNLLIEKGWIMFTGPLEQPYLDIEAVRNPDTISDDVTVGVQVVGLADAPQVSLFSEPSMSQNEMLSYLLRGRALSDSEQDDNALSSMLLSAGIGRAEGLVGNVGSTLGLNDLSLSTAGSGSSTQVEVSAYVLPGVQVRYGMGVFDPVNELTIKYEILPKLFIEAFSGLNSALDVYYEFYLE
ncbi:translocation/assembly module TamB domain-containing protein [Agarivorans sp. Alg241-V36]|uniref:autotransporter assembly complex protein TamB n=1 Tax=Agarivorans sp. Alg241-V36 TaxID=2305992 RepID=UPI0013D46DE7|nr:translocation/assembly module TamB domain-containing protein [Agarivorans sp. Alg241-V36]